MSAAAYGVPLTGTAWIMLSTAIFFSSSMVVVGAAQCADVSFIRCGFMCDWMVAFTFDYRESGGKRRCD